MIAGGSEAAICEIGIAGFNACKALSTNFNDEPERASRPYDRDRDGFVMGEGAGIVVLEELEHARARGAKIYAEVVGYGLSGDAYHITSPAPDGDGGFRSMSAALKAAGITPDELDYVNAHGTSTPMGDEIELNAVARLLGNSAGKVTMSSTKSATGHLLGAAGAVEAIFGVLAIRDQVAPPTINLENPSVETPIDLAPRQAVKRKIDVVLSNSFGFGGTNASLVLRRRGVSCAAMMRHVAANALTLLILGLVVIFGIVTWAQSQYREKGPLAAPIDFAGRARRGAGERGGQARASGRDLERDGLPDRGALLEPRGRAEVRRVQHPGRRLDARRSSSCSTRAATWCGRWWCPRG